MKIRSRKFEGRCSKHKRYNPSVDGLAGIRGGCPRCQLLLDIWQTAFHLNGLIRKFDPAYDDIQRPAQPTAADPRQMSLIDSSVMDFRGE